VRVGCYPLFSFSSVFSSLSFFFLGLHFLQRRPNDPSLPFDSEACRLIYTRPHNSGVIFSWSIFPFYFPSKNVVIVRSNTFRSDFLFQTQAKRFQCDSEGPPAPLKLRLFLRVLHVRARIYLPPIVDFRLSFEPENSIVIFPRTFPPSSAPQCVRIVNLARHRPSQSRFEPGSLFPFSRTYSGIPVFLKLYHFPRDKFYSRSKFLFYGLRVFNL